MSRAWSANQNQIFDFVRSGSGNAIVEAVAGSGKTTTMVEAQKIVMHQNKSNVFLAFNKSIAEELKQRGVNGRTFHSITYSPVTRHKGVRDIADDKMHRICKAKLSGDEMAMYGTFINRLVGLAKQSGMGPLLADTQANWMGIVEYHDLELEDDNAELGVAVDLAREALHWSNESPLVDFDDLLYLSVKEGLTLPKFEFLFVDEAQDTNAIQRAILRKMLLPNSRIVAVGDPAQAIYGFRGADSNSLSLIAREFSCESLPLTVTYRCPTKVVEYVHQWVSHIQAAPGAPEGEVMNLGQAWDHSIFNPQDLVVCRTTKPLIALAFQMIKQHRPVFVMGSEIGKQLKGLIKKLKANSLEELEAKLEIWETAEVEKAVARQKDSKVATIQDKAATIRCLIEGMDDGKSINDLNLVIDQMFINKADATILATIHKAKGLEANRVFWLNRSACPSKWARQDWQRQQEDNLCYVAATRAIKSLVMIEEQD